MTFSIFIKTILLIMVFIKLKKKNRRNHFIFFCDCFGIDGKKIQGALSSKIAQRIEFFDMKYSKENIVYLLWMRDSPQHELTSTKFTYTCIYHRANTGTHTSKRLVRLRWCGDFILCCVVLYCVELVRDAAKLCDGEHFS